MGFALRKEDLPRYTYKDYLNWEGLWELIDGVPYAMSPAPSGMHQWACGELYAQFYRELEGCKTCRISMPMDWKISDITVLQPDLFVACFDFKTKKFIDKKPELVVEVLSPSNRNKDLEVKFRIYEEQGVKYYVVVDIENGSYIIYELNGKGYKVAKKGSKGDFTFDFGRCKAKIDFSKIW